MCDDLHQALFTDSVVAGEAGTLWVSSYSRLQTQLVRKRCLLMCGIHGGLYTLALALAYIGTSYAGFLTSALCSYFIESSRILVAAIFESTVRTHIGYRVRVGH